MKELWLRCEVKEKRYIVKAKKMFDLSVADNYSPKQQKQRREKLKEKGVKARNYERSLYVNRISPACLKCPHCYKYGSTIYVTLDCNRQCFFCFRDRPLNPPEIPFKLIEDRIRELHRTTKMFDFSLGEGEPFLEPDKIFRALKLVNNLTENKCYTYIYTNGDLLDEKIFKKLKAAELNEIRISIKPGDWDFQSVILAKKYIPHVIVEVPVFPGDEENMKKLFRELNKLDIFGINLCELIYSGNNKVGLKTYQQNDYRLKTDKLNPYKSFNPEAVPIYGSEETAFNLLEYVLDKKFSMGVHYCSYENLFSTHINERIFKAKKNKKPYESVTKYGLLKKLVVYFPDHLRALKDLKKNNVPDEEIFISTENIRLETHIKNLIFLNQKDYDVAVVQSSREGEDVKVKVLRGPKSLDRKKSRAGSDPKLLKDIELWKGALEVLEIY